MSSKLCLKTKKKSLWFRKLCPWGNCSLFSILPHKKSPAAKRPVLEISVLTEYLYTTVLCRVEDERPSTFNTGSQGREHSHPGVCSLHWQQQPASHHNSHLCYTDGNSSGDNNRKSLCRIIDFERTNWSKWSTWLQTPGSGWSDLESGFQGSPNETSSNNKDMKNNLTVARAFNMSSLSIDSIDKTSVSGIRCVCPLLSRLESLRPHG